MTLPGVPVVFAGDEFGMVGVDGEASRTPIPWGTEDKPETAERLELYRELIALRREHPVLGDGGLRWLHVDDETIVFIRESAAERVLVLATSGGADVVLEADALPGASEAQSLVGEAVLNAASDGTVAIVASGPAFAAWSLPGVIAPSRADA